MLLAQPEQEHTEEGGGHISRNKKAKYTVRHDDRSFCTQKQPKTAALKAATSDSMVGQPGVSQRGGRIST